MLKNIKNFKQKEMELASSDSRRKLILLIVLDFFHVSLSMSKILFGVSVCFLIKWKSDFSCEENWEEYANEVTGPKLL